MIAYRYEGDELGLFEHAVNWKRYFNSHIAGHIRGHVLEVGSGLGGTTRLLCDGRQSRWTALEPDASLAELMRQRLASEPLPSPIEVQVGTLADLPAGALFDTILYIDVLEHIQDDRAEMGRAAAHLAPGGRVVVLAPAHQVLYTPFDKAIGHYRRYSAATLRAAAPTSLREERVFYLDSVGLLASLGNRLLLRSAHPSLRQIRFWDRVLVRASRLTDPLFGRRLGKTVVGIWQREDRPGRPTDDRSEARR
jgi:SAM-dependent methyltransferase